MEHEGWRHVLFCYDDNIMIFLTQIMKLHNDFLSHVYRNLYYLVNHSLTYYPKFKLPRWLSL